MSHVRCPTCGELTYCGEHAANPGDCTWCGSHLRQVHPALKDSAPAERRIARSWRAAIAAEVGRLLARSHSRSPAGALAPQARSTRGDR